MTTLQLPVSNTSVHIGGYAHVPADEILFCQSDSNYTHVHFLSRRKITVATTLGTLEERLIPQGFVRVNRSEMVNKEYIKSYDTSRITLINGATLPIARRRRKEVLKSLSAFLGLFQIQELHYA